MKLGPIYPDTEPARQVRAGSRPIAGVWRTCARAARRVQRSLLLAGRLPGGGNDMLLRDGRVIEGEHVEVAGVAENPLNFQVSPPARWPSRRS